MYANTYYSDPVQIHTITTQTVDLKPRCANEIFMMCHSQVSSLTLKSESQDNSTLNNKHW